MKQLFLLGVSLLAISACAPQPAPPPPAVAVPAGTPAPGSPSNTTRAFDGNYANAIARNVTPGCPDFVTGRALVIRNGLATFQSGVLATGTLNFQGYVNPQGQLSMVSQQGQTFQGPNRSQFCPDRSGDRSELRLRRELESEAGLLTGARV